MTIIQTVPEWEASGETADFYAEDVHDLGYVASHTKVMSRHPRAYKAWDGLVMAVAGPMDNGATNSSRSPHPWALDPGTAGWHMGPSH